MDNVEKDALRKSKKDLEQTLYSQGTSICCLPYNTHTEITTTTKSITTVKKLCAKTHFCGVAIKLDITLCTLQDDLTKQQNLSTSLGHLVGCVILPSHNDPSSCSQTAPNNIDY